MAEQGEGTISFVEFLKLAFSWSLEFHVDMLYADYAPRVGGGVSKVNDRPLQSFLIIPLSLLCVAFLHTRFTFPCARQYLYFRATNYI